MKTAMATTVYGQCLQMVREHERGLTYDQAALLVNCDTATAGKAFRYWEARGEVTIDRSTFPYIVRLRSSLASEGV